MLKTLNLAKKAQRKMKNLSKIGLSSKRQSSEQKTKDEIPRDLRFISSHPPNLIIGQTTF